MSKYFSLLIFISCAEIPDKFSIYSDTDTDTDTDSDSDTDSDTDTNTVCDRYYGCGETEICDLTDQMICPLTPEPVEITLEKYGQWLFCELSDGGEYFCPTIGYHRECRIVSGAVGRQCQPTK